jgi:ABC-type protease/lipase transport system fused ATPase/permease subunit
LFSTSRIPISTDMALSEALASVRARGGILIVVAHRPTALMGLDQVLVMNGGKAQAFGSKDEILKMVAPQQRQSASTIPAVAPAIRHGNTLKIVTGSEVEP